MTHHPIVERVEPFSRQGLRLDLSASDRLQRRRLFCSVERAGEPTLRETLQRDDNGKAWWRLTRTLAVVVAPGAPQAPHRGIGGSRTPV